MLIAHKFASNCALHLFNFIKRTWRKYARRYFPLRSSISTWIILENIAEKSVHPEMKLTEFENMWRVLIKEKNQNDDQ